MFVVLGTGKGETAVDIKGFGHEAAFRPQSIKLDIDLEKRNGKLGLSKRIVTASDDPSGAGILARMEARAAGFGVGQQNARAGMGLTRSASGALDGVSRSLERMRELATQAASGTFSDQDRINLDTEFQSLKDEIGSSLETDFGGLQLFSGDTVSFGVGPDVGDTVDVQLPDSAASAFADLDVLSVSTSAGAAVSLQDIDVAIDAVASAQAEIGSSEQALSSASSVAAQSKVSAAASASTLGDADIAMESAELARTGILRHAVLSMQIHSALNEALVGKLLS